MHFTNYQFISLVLNDLRILYMKDEEHAMAWKLVDKRVVNVTVRPFVADCEDAVRFTGLMLQEGDMLSGCTPHTEICLKESESDPVWFNGNVRAHRVPAAGEICAAFVFNAGNGRWRCFL